MEAFLFRMKLLRTGDRKAALENARPLYPRRQVPGLTGANCGPTNNAPAKVRLPRTF
jgi:hypothetical protein